MTLSNVAVTAGNLTMSYYTNGILQGTSVINTGVFADGRSFMCDGIVVGAGYYNGPGVGGTWMIADDLRIYNTALTAAQVRSVYSSQGAPAPSRAMPLPKLAWDFNGTTTDYVSGAVFSGTQSYTTGKYGKALNVNSATGQYQCNFSSNIVTDNGFSVSTWIQTPGSASPYCGYIYSDVVVQTQLLCRYGFISGKLGVEYYDPNDGVTVAFRNVRSISTFNFNTWYHLSFVLSGSSKILTLYVNGVLQESTSYTTNMSGTTAYNRMFLFTNASAPYYECDLRIFDRALTSAQVKSIYNQQGVPGRGVQVTSLTYNAPLTGVANMNRIYGIQLLNLNYTGNIINIRRSSDNSNVNFTVDSTNTTLVTASGGQTLASWLGAGTANVVIWYDQSGNGRNLTQVTSTLQPGFSETTGVQFRNLLYMAFPDNCSLSDATICTGFVQNQYLLGNPSSQWYNQDAIISCERGGGTDDWGLVLPGSGLFGFGSGPSDPQVSISTNGLGSYSFMSMTRTNTSGGVTLYKGNGPGTSFTMPSGTKSGTNPSYMGYNQPGNKQYMNSDISSFIWLDSVQPTSFVSLLSSRFLNSKFVPNRSSMTGTPLFTQLSPSATSSVVGAFSLRAVNGTSTKAVRVKRSSDNAQQDFWADRLGNLLTAPISGQTLQSWLGDSAANIVTWYDQSGQGRDATGTRAFLVKTSNVNQQWAVNPTNGGLSLSGGAFLNGTDFTITCTTKRLGTQGNDGIYGYGANASWVAPASVAATYGANTRFGLVMPNAGSTSVTFNDSSYAAAFSSNANVVPSAFVAATEPTVYTAVTFTSALQRMHINGTANGLPISTLTQLTANASTGFTIGSVNYYGNFLGEIGELLIFNQVLSTQDIATLYSAR
jgi:hypothetical protein